MDSKQLSRVEIKDADRGEVTAVIATFNTVDLDGDVTVPGAFDGVGEVPISAYGHGSWSTGVPVGKGRIRSTASEAIFDGQFFMDSVVARDTFVAVKGLGPLGQWSYGYDPIEADRGQFEGKSVRFLKRLLVHEASPVLVGAGVNTRTLSAKEAASVQTIVFAGAEAPADYKAAIRPHTTAATARAWDPSAVVSAISGKASVSDLRSVFALVKSGGDPEAKSSYLFPHHHGVDGPANLRACAFAIAALNDTRNGHAVDGGDLKGVYNHLAEHLRDADREPPELGGTGDLKFPNDLLSVMAEMQRVTVRASEVMALRATKGKTISPGSIELL
ncbi:MAG: hypothetical protein ACREF4_22150, partial [Gammaproteobacteria bacterium]